MTRHLHDFEDDLGADGWSANRRIEDAKRGDRLAAWRAFAVLAVVAFIAAILIRS